MSRPLARPRSGRRREVAIVPLIDVVFVLLIFFMVAGKIASSDPFDLVPTRSEAEEAPPHEPALLHLGADGRLALDGEPIEEEALLFVLAARIAAGEPPEVRLKADGRAEAPELVRLLTALKGAGVVAARLLTVPATSGAGG